MKNNFFLKIIIFISVFSFFTAYTHFPNMYSHGKTITHDTYQLGIEYFCYDSEVPYDS